MPGPADTYIGYGRNWANVSNTPFREYKHWVHEGGIATPLVVHWPAGFDERGTLRRTPGHLIDIMATCADVANASYPTQFEQQPIQPLAGESLVPLFRGEPLQRKTLFWEHEGHRAVRQGNWKLVAKGKMKDRELPVNWELYDMESDRVELNNLTESHPDKVKELAELWQQYASRTGVFPCPKPKPKKENSKDNEKSKDKKKAAPSKQHSDGQVQ